VLQSYKGYAWRPGFPFNNARGTDHSPLHQLLALLADAINNISSMCQLCQQLQFNGSHAMYLQLHPLRAEEGGRKERELSEFKNKSLSVLEVNKVY